jgi:ABC-type proline/glycine betaine transport system permease subunit
MSQQKDQKKAGLWPAVETAEQARAAARQGMWAAVIVAAITVLFVALMRVGVNPLEGTTFDASALVDALLFAAIAWGIQRGSRIAAVAGLGLYLVERAYLWSQTGVQVGGLFVAAALTLAFVHGVRGTFALQRLRTRPATTAQAALSGEPLFR